MTEGDTKAPFFISAISSPFDDYQRVILLLIEAILVASSYYVAFALRFDGKIPPAQLTAYLQTVPWLLASRFLVAFAFRMHHRVWRYTGLWDLINLAAAGVVGTLLFATFVTLAINCPWIPRTVYAIDTVVVIILLGGARALRRILYEQDKREPGRRVLIFGAGDAGELIVRDMLHNSDYRYSPVGFVDDDRIKVGRMIHGIRVLGTRAEVADDHFRARPPGGADRDAEDGAGDDPRHHERARAVWSAH